MSNQIVLDSQRGSFAVAGALFLVVFLMVAGLAVDLSRYVMLQDKRQEIADGAALAGAQAIRSFGSDADVQGAYDAVFNYLSQKIGQDYVEDVHQIKRVNGAVQSSSDYADAENNVMVQEFGSGATAGGGLGKGINFTQGNSVQFMNEDGASVNDMSPSSVQAMGPAIADFDGDSQSDLPYLESSSKIKLIDRNDQTVEEINLPAGKQADLDKTLIGVGSWQGREPAIYYTGQGHSKIYRVRPGESPVTVAEPDNGVNAVSGTGDIDGDGTTELVFADGSQDPRYVEPSDFTAQVFSRMEKGNVGTPGSNNGIGYGAPGDFDGDGKDELPVVGGGNGVALLHANQMEDYLGSNSASGCNCAAKSPISMADVDKDGQAEVVYQNKSSNKLRYFDDDGQTQHTVTDDGGNMVDADDERGVVQGVTDIGKPYVNVGVIVYGQFEPYFLPSDVFGDDPRLVQTSAVAQAKPELQQRVIQGQGPDCDIYLKQKLDVGGKFNKVVSDGSVTNDDISVCGSAEDGEAQISDHKSEFSEFHLSDCSSSSFQDGGSTHAGCSEDAKSGIPDLKAQYQDKTAYDINVDFGENLSSWGSGDCKSGHQIRQNDNDKIYWYDSSGLQKEPVCVGSTATDFRPKGKKANKQPNKDWTLQADCGVGCTEEANIFVPNGNVSWRGNKSDMNGNIVTKKGNITVKKNGHAFNGSLVAGLSSVISTYDITIEQNNNTFDGTAGADGVALWATGGIQFAKNGLDIDGFVGTREGDIEFKSSGGGTTDFDGLMLSGGNIQWEPNNNTTFEYAPSLLGDLLDKKAWGSGPPQQQNVDVAYFANVSVRLID